GGGQVLRMNVVKDSAAPVLHVDSPRLNTKGETVLKVRGTGYTGEATPHGVRVVVSDTNVWVPGRFPQQGMRFVAEVTVPASQIHNGVFETEVKVPADVAATLNTSHKYIAGTMAAGVEGAEYGSFDAQKPLELFAQEPVVSAVPTYAPTVAPLPEATVGVNPTDAPTVAPLPDATIGVNPTDAPTVAPLPEATVGVNPTDAPTVAPLPEATVGVNPTDAPTVAPLPEATVGVNPTDAPTVPALPEATVGVNPTDAPTVPALPEAPMPADKAPADKVPAADQAPVADKTPNADKLEDATVAHPKSKPAQSKPPQEAPVTAARSAQDTPAKDSPKKATLANTGASSVGVIVVLGVAAICAGLGLSVLRSRRRS
ncbi:MAG: LPXTG cell wall anchor domain-containing protein, partial [Rothia mucilaginosa]|uniref:LPXTG cell wall anchor domain-containing protein n=1 Tax=Rothia mucilaginosa TaxID=43675 RepID=UPI001CB6524B